MTEQAHAVLAEIEAIKQLNARHCRFLDTKDWDAWRTIFTDDFVSDTSKAGGKVLNGADQFVTFVRKNLGPGVGLVGYGHCHETYEKRDGQWRIKTYALTRLREDVVTPVFSLCISERIRNAAVKAARRLTERSA